MLIGRTARLSEMARFRADPIAWMDAFARSNDGIRRLDERTVAIADPVLARGVLRNDDGCFHEHSDFFGSGRSSFDVRDAQIAIGRGAVDRLLDDLRARPVAALLAAAGTRQRWPEAGVALMEALARDTLAGPHRPAAFHVARDAALAARFALRPVRPWTRVRLRFAIYRAVERERDAAVSGGPPRDLLDLLVALAPDASTEKLVEMYLALNVAVQGSLGFAIGWALLLARGEDHRTAPPRHVFTEALRLHPVAWLLSRRVAVPHRLGSVEMVPDEEAWVLPYAVHRRPDRWPEPERFWPGRWSAAHDRAAWLPFGAGAHSCAAISLSYQLFERVWTALHADWHVAIEGIGPPAPIGVTLRPPPFTLALTPRR